MMRADERAAAYEAWFAEREALLADLRSRTVPTHTDLRDAAKDALGLIDSDSDFFKSLRAEQRRYENWQPSYGAARVVLREIAQTMAPSNTWGNDQTDV